LLPSKEISTAELTLHQPDSMESPHNERGAVTNDQRTHEHRDPNGDWATRSRHEHPLDQRSTEGTPLFTITEQNSVPTLRTMPSNWTFQRRILTWQPSMAREDHKS